MVVLGLLQNQWAHNPAAVAAMFDRHPERRSLYIACMLARSVSGRRLRRAFGAWMDRIIWENASPGVATKSRGLKMADPRHINRTLANLRPNIVITFGVSARLGIAASTWTGPTIGCVHPAARYTDTLDSLVVAAAALDAWSKAMQHNSYPEGP